MAVQEAEPGDHDSALILACLRLKLGDQAGYRALCTALLNGKSGTADPATVAHVASLAAGSTAKPGAIVALAREEAARHPTSAERLRWYGAALYRAGDDREAIRQLDGAVAARKTGGEAIDWLFLALAHRHAGERTEAGWCFEEAMQRIAEGKAKRIPATAREWAARFEVERLRQEAAALLSPHR